MLELFSNVSINNIVKFLFVVTEIKQNQHIFIVKHSRRMPCNSEDNWKSKSPVQDIMTAGFQLPTGLNVLPGVHSFTNKQYSWQQRY